MSGEAPITIGERRALAAQREALEISRDTVGKPEERRRRLLDLREREIVGRIEPVSLRVAEESRKFWRLFAAHVEGVRRARGEE